MRSNADPLVMQIERVGNQRSLLTGGMPGANCTLPAFTTLSPTAAWLPVFGHALANSFQSSTNPGNRSPVFYRLKRK